MSGGKVDPILDACRGVGGVFLVFGIMIGAWAPHIPLIQARFELSQSTLGLILLVMGVGAIIAMSVAGWLVARIGSAAATRLLSWAYILSLPAAIAMPELVAMVVFLALFGGICGCLDITMNAQAILVERKAGVPIMSWVHGLFSLGALVGAAAGGPLLVLMSPVMHMGLMALSCFVILLWSNGRLLAGSEDRSGPVAPFALPARAAIGLGILTLISFVTEAAMLDWTGLYLLNDLGGNPVLASAGFAACSLTMTIGRFMGDSLRRRYEAGHLLLGGFALAALGLVMALSIQSTAVAILGFGIAGFGLANSVPLLFAAAGRIDGLSAGAGLAGVASIGYLGFLIGPPVIGFLADLVSLRFALFTLALACTAAALAIPFQSRGLKR